MQPIVFILHIRNIWPDGYAPHSGGCLKFHKLLAAVFLHARGWYNSDHVITEIDGRFYDIDGERDYSPDYIPLAEFGEQYFKGAFRDV